MKKFNKLVSVVTMFVVLFGTSILYATDATPVECVQNTAIQPEAAIQPTDYSKEANWLYLDKKLAFLVDTFYLYPTAAMESAEEGGIVSEINAVSKETARFDFAKTGSVFEDYTNVFAPHYRQISAKVIPTVKTLKEFKALLKNNDIIKNDVFAALDYYFTNLNNGRPFILSSQSQGSFLFQIAMEEYFSKHPEYLDRMVAAYIIGCNITKKWLEENNLKFATGETDTGVIITWLTEGPKAKGGSLGKCLSINPINWKRDATPATVDQNKGSLISDARTKEITKSKGIADATLNLKRGTVVCTTVTNYMPDNPLFGNKSFHLEDHGLYYENIKENGQKRIQAYLEQNKK